MEVKNIISELIGSGFNANTWYNFKSENSEQFVKKILNEVLPDYEWIPEYDLICEWLSDNHGKGLILLGTNGRGKTIFSQKVFPIYFYHFYNKILKYYNCSEINDRLDEILTKKLIIIDDIGNESQKVEYGERRWSFPEIIDYVEKNRLFIILTTNLTPDAIEKKYGIRTRERIRACCLPIKFVGKSFRV